jgi:uncharacterized Zn finger protein (UPF0148 family)
MTTPTCRTCGAKFPGRVTCKVCGADPALEPTVEQRVQRMNRMVKIQMTAAAEGFTKALKEAKKSMEKVAAVFNRNIDVSEMHKYERRVIRAKERSIRSTTRTRGHGRQVR